jgi:hypothetical protein
VNLSDRKRLEVIVSQLGLRRTSTEIGSRRTVSADGFWPMSRSSLIRARTKTNARQRRVNGDEQTLMTCPHCGNDFLINEAGDGAISVERVDMPPNDDATAENDAAGKRTKQPGGLRTRSDETKRLTTSQLRKGSDANST